MIALIISAAVLIGGLLAFPPDLSFGNNPPAATSEKEKRNIHVSQLGVRLGKGLRTADKPQRITELAKIPDDRRAIATRFISFDASDYPIVEYTITGRYTGTYVYLLWKAKEAPRKFTPRSFSGVEIKPPQSIWPRMRNGQTVQRRNPRGMGPIFCCRHIGSTQVIHSVLAFTNQDDLATGDIPESGQQLHQET